VMGNDRIKMSTSIIDYIFRELAINYLGRGELAHVSEEDLRHDAMGTTEPEPEYLEEETLSTPIVSEHSINVDETPMSVERSVVPNGVPAGRPALRMASASVELDAVVVRRPAPKPVLASSGSLRIQAIVDAKAKGYEGDSCPECGAMTMVRNGSCLKCVSCGSTSGCS
jgi:ribonucleoside-diphosphate reductase alpha chain